MKWSTDHAFTLGERTWRGENAKERKTVWMTHWSCRLTGWPKIHKKCVLTLIIGSIFVNFLSHVKLIRIHGISYVFFDLTQFWRSQRSIFRFWPLWPWKVQVKTVMSIWCNFTKYCYSQHLVILAVIVTSEMTIVCFWLSPTGGHIKCPIGPKFAD